MPGNFSGRYWGKVHTARLPSTLAKAIEVLVIGTLPEDRDLDQCGDKVPFESICWMEITSLSKPLSENGRKTVRQIESHSEEVDMNTFIQRQRQTLNTLQIKVERLGFEKFQNSEPQRKLRRHHPQPQQQFRCIPTRDRDLHEAREAIVRQYGRLAGCSRRPGSQVLGLLDHVGQVGRCVVL